MEVEFDSAKDVGNVAKHGISLARVSELEIRRFVDATREEDGEHRFRLFGLIDGSAYCGIVALRGSAVRAISLRKANRTERKRYDL